MAMNPTSTRSIFRFLNYAGLAITFFLPWTMWQKSFVSGYQFPSGKFFSISAARFGLENPYPQLDFTFRIFWLIPVFCGIGIAMLLLRRKNGFFALASGAIALCLLTIFVLFNSTLVQLGVGTGYFRMLEPAAILAALFSLGMIFSVYGDNIWLKRIPAIIAGPLFAWVGFMMIKHAVLNTGFDDMKRTKADYTMNAADLMRQFSANDSLANSRYREKIIGVNGRISQFERSADSTATLQFSDSAAGCYIIFSFDKPQFFSLANLKTGDIVSVKGSCSGSIHSSILGTTSISFKRSVLNK